MKVDWNLWSHSLLAGGLLTLLGLMAWGAAPHALLRRLAKIACWCGLLVTSTSILAVAPVETLAPAVVFLCVMTALTTWRNDEQQDEGAL